MNPRNRRLLWIALLGAAALAAFAPEPENPAPEIAAAASPAIPSAPVADPPEKPEAAPAPAPPAQAGVDIFAAKTWTVAAAPPPPPPPPAPSATTPVPPPLPYVFLGRLEDGTVPKAFLQRGELAYVVAPGQVLDGLYRVEGIDAGQITLIYLPLGATQILSAGSSS